MSPIPVPQLCAELRAHALRAIQNLLINRTHDKIITMADIQNLKLEIYES